MMRFRPKDRGVTLIEVLLVVVLLVVLMSFAIPSFSGANTQAEMRVAGESLQFAIRSARNTARMTESAVSMNLQDDLEGAGQRISFSTSGRDGTNAAAVGIQDFQFKKEIKLVSAAPSYEFDSRGIVSNPGHIILVSTLDESLRVQIPVE